MSRDWRRGAHATRPKRGRNAQDVRILANAADAHLRPAPAAVGAIPSGPSEGAPRRARAAAAFGPEGARAPAREVQCRERRRRAARAPLRPSPAKRDGDRRDGPPRARDAGDPTRERKFDRPQGRPRLQPARAGRRDRTARTVARAQISNQDRRAQGCATETGRRAAFATRAAMAGRRANVPQRNGTASAERVRREPGRPAIQRASASLTGLRAGRVPRLARVDRRDLRTRAVARAPTSNQDRRAQERVTEIGRRAPGAARAAKADRRAVAPRQGGALPPRKGPPKGAGGPRRPPRKP